MIQDPHRGRKSRTSVQLTLGAVITALMVVSACSSTPQKNGGTGTTSEKGPLTIGVSFRTERQGRWVFELKEMQARAKQLGVKLIAQEANENPQTQASQVENMLSQGVNAIVLGAVDAGAGKSLVQEAHRQKVPVIAYDTPLDDPNLSYVVIRDDVAVGELQAKEAAKFSAGGSWAIIKGDPSAGVARTISTGYDNVLKPLIASKKINVIYNQYTTQWSAETAQSTAENLVTKYGNSIKVFLSSSDGLAQGVTRVVSENHLAGKVFVSGLDAEPASLKLVADGIQTMTVWADLKTWADTALDAAVALAKGQKPNAPTTVRVAGGSVPATLIGITAITRSNLCNFVTKQAPEGYADKAKVFASNPSACP